MPSLQRWIPVCLLAVVAACGGSRLTARADAIDDLIAAARDNGAMYCAPVELAMAESHHDFALQEMREGRYYNAKTELQVAGRNARLAVEKSPPAKCAAKVPAKQRKRRVKRGSFDSDGDGLLDKHDECVNDPEDPDGYEDSDGCPDDDNDNDGLADKVDDCPMEPEDADGYGDDDGCPDEDNDADGLADNVDQCPDEAEDFDGYHDDDGCPDCDHDGDGVPECPEPIDACPTEAASTPDGCPQKYKLVVVTDKKIELKQTIYFNTGLASIKSVSYPLLDEVAEAMNDHATIVVRIEGHTDSRGSNRRNDRLSQARAESVRDYLIRRGVSPVRMDARGFGEQVPIADNRTAAGREQNRRVEFVIIRR